MFILLFTFGSTKDIICFCCCSGVCFSLTTSRYSSAIPLLLHTTSSLIRYLCDCYIYQTVYRMARNLWNFWFLTNGGNTLSQDFMYIIITHSIVMNHIEGIRYNYYNSYWKADILSFCVLIIHREYKPIWFSPRSVF